MTYPNWTEFFNNLSEEEKSAIALLRVIECTNGVIQYAFRDNAPHALSVEDTREAMNFSMGCMKRMEIPVGDITLKFSPETEEVLRQVRELYINGMKKGDEEARREFFRAAEATVKAVGLKRLVEAKRVLVEDINHPVLAPRVDWGLGYLTQFL